MLRYNSTKFKAPSLAEFQIISKNRLSRKRWSVFIDLYKKLFIDI